MSIDAPQPGTCEALPPSEQYAAAWGDCCLLHDTSSVRLLRNVTVLHVPKAGGTSFAFDVYQTARAQQRLGAWAHPVHYVNRSMFQELPDGTFRRHLLAWHPPLTRDAGCGRDGQCLTILRQPLRRTVSGFLHNLHDCYWMQRALGIESQDNNRTVHNWDADVIDAVAPLYAACVSRCTSRMLIGLECAGCDGTETHFWAAHARAGGTGAGTCLQRMWKEAFGGASTGRHLNRTLRDLMVAAINVSFETYLYQQRKCAAGWRRRCRPALQPVQWRALSDDRVLMREAAAALSRFEMVGILEEYATSMQVLRAHFPTPRLWHEAWLRNRTEELGGLGKAARRAERAIERAVHTANHTADTFVYDAARARLVRAARGGQRLIPRCRLPSTTDL